MASNAITTRDEDSRNPIVQLNSQLETRSGELKKALPSHISVAKFQRTVMTAVQNNPKLLTASRQSLVNACMRCALDGLLPDGREAALVPFGANKKIDRQWKNITEVVYVPMVYGVRKKILQARNAKGDPVVSALQVNVVYQAEVDNGYFRYEVGTEPPIQHRPMLSLTDEEAADDNIVAAYSIATMADGTRSYELMRRFEINKVRQTSQTGALNKEVKYGPDKGMAIQPGGPWVDWFGEMAKKTVLKRHAKVLPQSGDLIFEDDDEDERGNADSTLAVLNSHPGGQFADGRSDDRPDDADTGGEQIHHDAETGEIHDEQPEPEKEKPRRGRPPKAKEEPEQQREEPSAVGNERASADTPDATDGRETPAQESRETSGNGQTATTSASRSDAPHTDLLKELSLPEKIIGNMEDATSVTDLEKVYDENADAINDMEGADRSAILGHYSRNMRRLNAGER